MNTCGSSDETGSADAQIFKDLPGEGYLPVKVDSFSESLLGSVVYKSLEWWLLVQVSVNRRRRCEGRLVSLKIYRYGNTPELTSSPHVPT